MWYDRLLRPVAVLAAAGAIWAGLWLVASIAGRPLPPVEVVALVGLALTTPSVLTVTAAFASGRLALFLTLRYLPRWGQIVSGVFFVAFILGAMIGGERGSLGTLGAAGVVCGAECLAMWAESRARRPVRS